MTAARRTSMRSARRSLVAPPCWRRKFLAAVAASTLGCGNPAGRGVNALDGGSWRKLAPLGLGARQETGVAALKGLIYVLGGFTDELAIVPRVEAYDPGKDEWTEVAPLPFPMHHVNTTVVDDRLYVLGALMGGSFTAIGDAFTYDPATGSWKSLTSMPLGTERGAGGTAAIGTKIYVAGGFRQNASVPDFSVYDTANDTWEVLPGLGEGRDHLIAAAAYEKLYVIGGRRDGVLRGDVHEFDPAAGKWAARASMPTPRAGMAGALVVDRILVSGGEGNPRDPSGVFPENEAYDPKT